jgi:predicted O-methyltransferase YrrM
MDKRTTEQAVKNKMLNNAARRRKVFPTTGGIRRTRGHLAELLGELGFKVGAEIGVRIGRFSRKLCDKNPGVTLYCIDPWLGYNSRYNDAKQEGIYQKFIRNIENYPIKIIRKFSMDALPEFEDKSLDFIFIDGNHKFDFVMMDIICWSKKVKAGGIVMCHDFYPFDDCGVWNAVRAYTHSHNLSCYVTKEHEPTAYWVNP